MLAVALAFVVVVQVVLALAGVKLLSKRIASLKTALADASEAIAELRSLNRNRVSEIEQMERRFETSELTRKKAESEWLSTIGSAKQSCDAHSAKVTWYVHELQQELSVLQTAGAQREKEQAKATAFEREQSKAREQMLRKRIAMAEKSAAEAEQSFNSMVEWTVTDKLLQLGGDHDSVRDNTAVMLEGLRAKELFASLAVKFASAVAIDILASFEPAEKYRPALLQATKALADKSLRQKRYREAKVWYARAQEINNQQPDSIFFKDCLFGQAAICKQVDDAFECLVLFGQLMENQLILEKIDLTGYAQALVDVAEGFEAWADMETAVHIRKRLHETHLRHNLGNSPDAAANLTALAKVLLKMNHYEEAVPVGLKALSICRMHLAPRDQRIQSLLSTLARCFTQMRKLQRATDIYACLSAANIQGNDFAQAENALEALEAIAHEYRREERWQKAAEAYAICERQYHKIKPQHPGVWRQLQNMAECLSMAGNQTACIAVLERLRSQLKSSRGEVSSDLHVVLMQLAHFYCQRNDWQKEEAVLLDAIETSEARDNQRHTAMFVLQRLAARRIAHAQYKDAESDYVKLISLFPNMSLKPDPLLAQSYGGLGNARLLLRDFDGSEEALKRQIELVIDINGAEDLESIKSLMELSALYLTAGRLADARACSKRVLSLRRRFLGGMHADTIASIMSMGALECLAANFEESATYYDQALIAAACINLPAEKMADLFEQFSDMEIARGNQAKAKSLSDRAKSLNSQALVSAARSGALGSPSATQL